MESNIKKVLVIVSQEMDGTNAYECTKCDQKLSTCSGLEEHIQTKHWTKSDAGSGQQSTSSKPTSSKSTSSKSSSKLYKCDICGKKNKTIVELNEHISRRHEFKRKFFNCTICKQSFQSYLGRRIHIRKSHATELPIACEMCLDRFKDANELLVHEQVRHTKGTVVKCKWCGNKFVSTFQMQEHHKQCRGQ